MCNHTCSVHKHTGFVARAALASMGIRAPLRKANPLDDDDFVVMSETLAQELAAVSGPLDTAAVNRAIRTLAVDWAVLTAPQQAAIIRQATAALAAPGPRVAARTESTISTSITATIGDTKIAVSEQVNFALSTSFDAIDQRVLDNVLRSHAFFVTNEYGAHAQAFSMKAQDIVRNGLAQGLRSSEITKDLHAAARAVGLERPKHYWRVVATSAQNRGRTESQLQGYRQAGVERFEFQAVMDQRTTDICRMLDGKIFQVQNALDSYENVAQARGFDSVKDYQPWVRRRKSEDPGVEFDLFIKQRDGSEVSVGQVTQSAVGKVDQRGRFTNAMDNSTLAQFGLTQPPLHGLCRSIVQPIVS